ncbi:hypothetical protein AERO9AM_70002 [Aeromicrobium sp. 9AM]|nr:hypothetical protein AERO9AM_70002 [Aeromicrobium sp. 9AM]
MRRSVRGIRGEISGLYRRGRVYLHVCRLARREPEYLVRRHRTVRQPLEQASTLLDRVGWFRTGAGKRRGNCCAEERFDRYRDVVTKTHQMHKLGRLA